MPLEKYGPEALGEDTYEEVQEQAAAEVGSGESVFGPEALEGGHSEEEVMAAAERAGQDPDQWVGRGVEFDEAGETATAAPPSSGGGEPETGGENEVELGGEAYAFPPGYTAEHVGGGKYRSFNEQGSVVENPDHDKNLWDKAATADAAWVDYEGRASEQASSASGGEQVSVEKLEEILAEEPALLDERQAAEMMREGGPRQEALKVILEHAVEQGRSEIVQVVAGEIEDREFVEETIG